MRRAPTSQSGRARLWWDGFTWKVEVFASKIKWKPVVVIGALIVYFAAPYLAPLAFGARGDLLGIMLEWLGVLALGGVFAVLCLVFFLAARSSPSRRALAFALLGGVAVFGGISLFAGWQAALSGADLALPFQERDVQVARTYHEESQTGRGAIPETGGWHIVTTDGDDYRFRDSGDGDQVHLGRYRMELSYFKHLVMSAATAP
jgi:hypothetical protein